MTDRKFAVKKTFGFTKKISANVRFFQFVFRTVYTILLYHTGTSISKEAEEEGTLISGSWWP